MMNNALLICLVTAVVWAAAPLLIRLSGANAMMMGVLVTFGTLLVSLPFAIGQNWATASPRAIMIGLLAGLFNGIGLFTFYRLVAGWNEGLWDISRVAPIVFVLVSVFTVFGVKIFYGEAITGDKMIGVGFACLAIWFLK